MKSGAKPTRLELNLKRLEILDYAREHGLLINPAKGFELQVEYFFKFGYCPCDPTKTRTTCPCGEVAADIAQTGHCLCKLFWKDYATFRKLYEEEDEKGTSQEDSPGPGRGGE